MIAATMTAEAAAYLAAVERELADLPAEERAELLEDLGLHLQALQEESDDRPLDARLGSSVAYAVELRTAAGLPPRSAAKGQRMGWLTDAFDAVSQHRALTEVRAFLPELRPAWWVLRGYLIVLVPCVLNGGGRAFLRYVDGPFNLGRAREDFPVPSPFDSNWLGLLMVMVAVVVSVRIGRKQPRGAAGAAVVLLNTGLVLATLALAATANDAILHRSYTVTVTVPAAVSSLASPHGPVTNVFAYSADGKPLTGVLLYDQDGRPLKASLQEWWADRCARVLAQPKAVDGVPVPQIYPQTYVLDPRGVSLNGTPVTAGQCRAIPAPVVQLPRLPK